MIRVRPSWFRNQIITARNIINELRIANKIHPRCVRSRFESRSRYNDPNGTKNLDYNRTIHIYCLCVCLHLCTILPVQAMVVRSKVFAFSFEWVVFAMDFARPIGFVSRSPCIPPFVVASVHAMNGSAEIDVDPINSAGYFFWMQSKKFPFLRVGS